MDFTIADFDFKVGDLSTAEEVDKLLDEYNLQIEALTVKLSTGELQLKRAENRSDNLIEDIQEVEAKIATKETELASLPDGREKERTSIEIDGLKYRLRGLQFRRGDSSSPLAVVERNADTGEAKLLLDFYTKFKTALTQRKTALGG